MSEQTSTGLEGEITHIFAHRFVVKTDGGSVLADLGPEGAKQVDLAIGSKVELTGEQKPSELKVAQFRAGDRTIEIERKPKPDRAEAKSKAGDIDPKDVLAALRSAGLEPTGEPHRKPKHFEVRATRDGEPVDVHVGLDGEIRKIKPIEANGQTSANNGL